MFASKNFTLTAPSNNPTGVYTIANSLRFRSSASAYLQRTNATYGTDQLKFTVSGWMKRGTSTALYFPLLGSDTGTAAFDFIGFQGDNLVFRTRNSSATDLVRVESTAVYRDFSSWYHIVAVYDSANATSTERVKLYVNGVQVTAFSTATYPSLNQTPTGTFILDMQIGRTNTNSSNMNYGDGYLAEVNFIDGQALTPSSFGAYNQYGVWQPMKYTGTYGTNGFYLKFNSYATAAALGTDSSGNNNTWTVNNISVTPGATYDPMTDVPTLTSALAANYATLNPLYTVGATAVLSNGNLQSTTGTTGVKTKPSTIAMSSGKWYWEVTPTAASSGADYVVGIALSNFTATGVLGNAANEYGYLQNGNKGSNGTFAAYGATYTTNDIISVALDLDAGTIAFYKNGVNQGTAYSGITGTYVAIASDGSTAQTSTFVFNFGQRGFTYTPPSGYKALNAFNLSQSTIQNGAKYMAATTYTGNGSTQTINNSVNGASFQPDLVWVKKRSAAAAHGLIDSVRGAGIALASNLTDAERNNGTGSGGDVIAFNSNGFNLGNNTTGSATDSNLSGATYIGWQWKANAGTNVTNTSGTITSTVSANTTAGFAVVTYTGNGTSGATVGHGLGVTPSMVIVKSRSATGSWPTYTAAVGNSATLLMDTTDAAGNYSGSGYPRNPNSTTFELYFTSTGTNSNANGTTYVAYCFAAVAGFSAFGSYTGNGSTDGPFIYTGFRPRFVMVKCSSNTTSSTVWTIWDTSRSPYNASVNELYPNLSAAEGVDSNGIDILSNGFKPKRNSEYANFSGWTYVYMAFAENPFKYALAR